MFLTSKRVETQIQRADKLMRVLWRLYSPYRKHRKLIVKASYKIMEVVEILEELKDQIIKDYREELKNPLESKSIAPGGYDKEKVDKQEEHNG